jgi:hypothetical protein
MSYRRPGALFVNVDAVTPPDETLVATIATIVTFAIVMPLIVKWWPRPKAKNSDDGDEPAKSRSGARKSPTSRAPASTTAAARAAQSKAPRTMGRHAPAAPGRAATRATR